MSVVAQWGLVALGSLVLSGMVFSAGNDHQIEANGIWHDGFDVSPRAPQRGQPFTLELRSFRFDLTSVTVRYYDGATTRWAPMAWNRAEENGTFDVWRATLPAIDSDFVSYRFELRDGSAMATLARSGFWWGEPPGGDFLLNLTPLGAFPLGATVDGSDTVFRVWAPGVEQAQVILNPDSATPTYVSLSPVAGGNWQARVSGVGHGQRYQYRFLRDGQWLVRNDPRARWLPRSLAYSIVEGAPFAWEDGDWVIPDLEDVVICEAHVGTFSGRGDGATVFPGTFREMADRHIADLVDSGVNVLQLMPVQEFPGDVSWGYNPAFLFAPESAYGSPAELKYLVNKCHQAGIAVWLDVVLNHFDEPSLPGNLGWFTGEDIYFYPASSGLRDTGVGPRPDYGRVEVRDYLVDSIRHLIEEYHIDGFRFDHTAWIKVNGEGWRLLQEISQMRARVHPRVRLTAEQWPNDPAVTRPVIWGGAGFDSQWSDAFHDNSRAALNALAYGDPSMAQIAAGLNHFGFAAREMIHYIESHDEARESPPFAPEGRVVQVADQINPHSDYGRGRGKLFYGLTMFGAAVPLILHGQEHATEIGFGDKEHNRVPWEYRELYQSYYRACRDMTWLRRLSPALRADRWQNVYHVNEGANILAWERAHDGHYVIIVANFANHDWGDYWIGLPQGGTWYETINTAAAIYGGSGTYQNGTITAFNGPSGGMPYSASLKLPRYSLVVLTKHPYNLNPRLDADRDGIEDAWERQYALNPNSETDADFDNDSDGLTARAEYLFATDPSAASPPPALQLQFTALGPEVSFPTVPGRYYEIEAISDLHNPVWQPVAAGLSTRDQTVPGLLRLIDAAGKTAPRRFYRVKLRADW